MLNNPILITGIQRSGSTIITKVMASAGAWTGDCTNMLENIGLKKKLDSYYQNKLFVDKKGQYPMPNVDALYSPFDWKEMINTILVKQGFDLSTPWLLKDSRIGQTWPIWKKAYPDAKWLIVRRRSGDIIHSCMNTGYMCEYHKSSVLLKIGVASEYDGWKWWIQQQEENFIKLILSKADCQIIWPDRMQDGDFSQMAEVIEWAGLKWNDSIIPMVENMLHIKK